MNRWKLFRAAKPLAAAALLVGVTLAVDGQDAPAPRPNIIVIQADDLGYGDLSAYGQTRFQTPNIDRLAAEGTRFTHYYSGSTVCAPSRAALMTGMHTGHGSVRGNGEVPLRETDTTIGSALQRAGYRTAIIGKWGLGGVGSSGLPGLKGFEYSFGVLDHRAAHRQFTDHLYRDGVRVEVNTRDYVNDFFTQDAIDFIGRDDARPFFLYLNYTVPHAELLVPEDSIAPFRSRFDEPHPFLNTAADARPIGYEGPSLGYRSQPTPHAAFAAMVTRMDRDVGRILERLRAMGADERTLVIFSSDNGPHNEGGGDPGFFDSSGPLRGIKRDLYEGGIRVPMIARWPGTVPAGRTSDHPWAHWDVFPTLVELAGGDAPTALDGMSMVRALEGQAQPTHEFFYWEFHERGFQQAVRTGDWKAIRLKPDAPLELYDLGRDPDESADVAAANPEVVARVETYLKTARTPSERWPVP